MKSICRFLNAHWGKLILALLLFIIIGVTVRPGQFILGNDNYSPEVRPGVTLTRSVINPTWRSYRALGVPSDSEQADIVRSAAFTLLARFIPLWILSQGYVFLAFLIGCFSVGYLASALYLERKETEKGEAVFLISGVFYAMNLVAFWMMYSPLKVFLAGYAFLPLVLWRLICWIRKPLPMQAVWLFISVALLTTSAMVPTTFIVESGLIIFVIVWETVFGEKRSWKQSLWAIFGALCIIFGTQLYWILPFISYVKTNSEALQQSYINRALTPGMLFNELKFNTIGNTLRYYFSWIFITNDDGTLQFIFRDWFTKQWFVQIGMFLPPVGVILGTIWMLVKKQWRLLWLPFLYIAGLILIVGANPPLGFLFTYLQKTIPLFEQVFRWQSSKLYPLMVIPMSVVGAYGFVVVASWVKQRLVRYSMYGVVVGFMCVLFWPYFTGNLVGKESFQSIPSAYYALSSYLTKQGIHDRIVLAPEANTLYFRNYSWGFFGSSFMNYLIDNPLIEKALTTGSMESEGAQNLMEQALYSGDQKMFVQTLRLYHTPYVLLDTSATRLHNGYTYDWDTIQIMVAKNPALTLVWQESFLSLYRINASIEEKNTEYSILYSGHNFQTLNTFFARTPSVYSYVSNLQISGLIYPLALQFSSVEEGENNLHLTSFYTGPADTFVWDMKQSKDTLPTTVQINHTKETMTVESAYPRLVVGGKEYQQMMPSTSYKIPEYAAFMSIGMDVFPIVADTTWTIESPIATAAASMQFWNNTASTSFPVSGTQEKYQLQISKKGIMSLSLTLTPEQQGGMVNICVWSSKTYDCVNKDQSILVDGPKQVTILVPRIVSAGEQFDVYIQSAQSTFPISTKGIVQVYGDAQKAIGMTSSTGYTDSLKTNRIPLVTGDTITVLLPKIVGWNTYHYTPLSDMVPTIPKSECMADTVTSDIQTGVSFVATDCPSQISIALKRIKPMTADAISLLTVVGSNTNGIPLLLRVRKEKDNRAVWEDRLQYKKNTTLVKPMVLPQETISYDVEAYSYGDAKHPSKNALSLLSLQHIPASWYQWHLVPESVSSTPVEAVVATNQAYHDGWTISHSTDCIVTPVRINGWEQGWIDTGHCTSMSTFTPNTLAYLGYWIAGGCIGFFLILWPLKKMIGKRWTSRTSAH